MKISRSCRTKGKHGVKATFINDKYANSVLFLPLNGLLDSSK